MPKRSDWLDDELARVTWKGFHVVRPYTGPLREDLPPSYAALAARVGAARLYLSGRTHQIMIVCPPEEDLVGDVPVLRVGVANDSDAYLVVSELAAGRDVRVYEAFDGELEPTGPTFGGWLAACADEARREYSADDWARLERGPEPFTAEELALLEARRKLEWRFTGGGPEGTLRFVIRNRSSRRVKALTVGVRAKGGDIEARLPIDTSNVAPGAEATIDVDGYATLPADEAEVYALPEPTPSERDDYAELATSGPMKR